MYVYISEPPPPRTTAAGASRSDPGCPGLGDSKNTVRGYCLDIPRSEESLND